MPRKQLQESLSSLHQQLESTEALEPEDREALLAAMEDIRAALAVEAPANATPEESLSGRVYAMIEDLETAHPKLADLLRNLSESLANLGI